MDPWKIFDPWMGPVSSSAAPSTPLPECLEQEDPWMPMERSPPVQVTTEFTEQNTQITQHAVAPAQVTSPYTVASAVVSSASPPPMSETQA